MCLRKHRRIKRLNWLEFGKLGCLLLFLTHFLPLGIDVAVGAIVVVVVAIVFAVYAVVGCSCCCHSFEKKFCNSS